MDKFVSAVMKALEQVEKDYIESLKPMWYVTITTKDGVSTVIKYKAEYSAQAVIGVLTKCLASGIDVVKAEATVEVPTIIL